MNSRRDQFLNQQQGNDDSTTLASLRVIALALIWIAQAGPLSADGRSRVLNEGGYYPGSYYSGQYLYGTHIPPGTKAVRPALVPYDQYGRHRLGESFPPLASGSVLSDRFPYRYRPDFVPVPFRRPILPDPCDFEERLRHYKTFPSPFVPPLPPPHALDVQRFRP